MSVAVDQLVFVFEDEHLIARGALGEVLAAVIRATDAGGAPLVFDATTGRVIDLDLRGGLETARGRLTTPVTEKRGPGRPKLGVTAREVTLLPRHWDWLAAQSGGASVSLRKLVEAAMKAGEGPDRARQAREATYRFMTAVAGDLPQYEEAVRLLFAGDWTAFDAVVEAWPVAVRDVAREMAAGAWRNGVPPLSA